MQSPVQSNAQNTTGLCPCFRGDIACSLQLPYGGFTEGEYIPAKVNICNRSNRTIQSATLALYRVSVSLRPREPFLYNVMAGNNRVRSLVCLFWGFFFCLLLILLLLFTTALSQWDFSHGKIWLPSLGKPAATESRYPTYGACWVF